MRALLIALSALLLSSCGGGGGGDNACSTVKIAGGDNCGDDHPGIALVYTEYRQGIALCTGAYISPTAVLTAAHCVTGEPNRIGVASPGNLRHGTQYYINGYYDGRIGSPFDMAIVKVNAPLYGTPLPLLRSRHPDLNEQVVAYGYGFDQDGEDGVNRIQSGDAPLKATYTTYAGYYNGTERIVSSGEGSPCPGDSGGPVLAKGVLGEYGIFGITRSGPDGCDATGGRPALLSSMQSNGAVDFILRVVPDASHN